MIDLATVPRLARSLGRMVQIARTLVKYGLADAFTRLDYRFMRRWTRDTEVARLSELTREAR
ncbi:MAG TPA: AarF/ABC1/UbiB kinase family protein, partial [Gemmata sp.]|nr:AarF/ABC1/UbiB kinase family protein [Gemmata sp.]